MAWREQVARTRRASFRDETYWGRPVPSFGDPAARLLVVGLAPAAHGANRTGRMFTGDRSGDWLYGSLYRAGYASQPTSTDRDDRLELRDVLVSAAVRCAPPANKPLPAERDACAHWLHAELDLLSRVRVIVPLGSFAYTQTLRVLADRGVPVPRPRVRFGHGVEVPLSVSGPIKPPSAGPQRKGPQAGPQTAGTKPMTLLCSYHPSQQNTFTGTLTREMFDAIWSRARELVAG